MGILFGISAGAYFRWMKITQPSKTVKLVAVSIFVFTFAFIMGFTQSRSYLKDGDGSHQIVTEGETLTTKIIRSGDRVMLFLDVKANQLGFLRWDSIKKVTANR